MVKVAYIKANNIRDAWLSAIGQVLYDGDNIKTEYDKPNDPLSKDATVLIEVIEPFNSPITRKDKIMKLKTKYGNSFEVYGCMADTYLIGSIQSGYIEEIMEGINDHYIWESGLSFPYSYHDRIYNYTAFSLEDSVKRDYEVNLIDKNKVKSHEKVKHAKRIFTSGEKEIWRLDNGIEIDLNREIAEQIGIEKIMISLLNLPRINQIDYIIQKLKENPNTRRAQAITWRPYVDPYSEDPPCLQRIFMRIKENKLLMQTSWRSRDLFRAWEANVNGMIRIQKYIAEQLNVEVGHYLDFSNSLHIYGSNILEVKDMLVRMKNKGELFPTDLLELMGKET